MTRVFRKDQETRYGIKPKISIQTKEHGDKWLSTFKTRGTENWTEGMEVVINVQEKGDFLNFDPIFKDGIPTIAPTSDLTPRIEALEKSVFGAVQSEIKTDVEPVEAEDESSDF